MIHHLPITRFILSFILCFTLFVPFVSSAHAAGKYEILPRDPKGSPVKKSCGGVCNCSCQGAIEQNHIKIRAHITDEFIKHRNWMIDEFFTKHILPAMAMMTSQLSAVSMQQVQMIGSFFDAKHQLETQLLFQQLMAEAHKDYQPSEGLCEIGTNVRSLAASERKSNLAHVAFANRTMARQLRNKDTVAGGDTETDIYSRLASFAKQHCSASDNANGLAAMCKAAEDLKSGGGGNEGSNGSNGSGSNNNTTSNSNNSSNQSNNNSQSGGGNGTNNTGSNTAVRFFAKDNTVPDGGAGTNLKRFSTIEYNDGDHYNNLTGNFTVPFDGQYQFNGSTVIQHDTIAALTLQKNDLDMAGQIGANAGRQTIIIDNVKLDLVEGDVIRLYTEESIVNGTHRFRGELIAKANPDDPNDPDNPNDPNDPNNPNTPTSPTGGTGPATKEQANKDVDFTETVETKLTLDVDFTEDGDGTADSNAIFALTANLFAHEPLPAIGNKILATQDGRARAPAYRYMDFRAIAAKRSVAQNAFTAIISERTKGDKEVAPYLKKLVTELGVKEQNIEELLGINPSYFAQMEVLTKSIYQNPVFYTELYDKPANVLRKGATLRAISLMQERDLYKSQLRSESVLAIILETMLHEEHNRVNSQLRQLEGGK